jgi:hypothetical protein
MGKKSIINAVKELAAEHALPWEAVVNRKHSYVSKMKLMLNGKRCLLKQSSAVQVFSNSTMPYFRSFVRKSQISQIDFLIVLVNHKKYGAASFILPKELFERRSVRGRIELHLPARAPRPLRQNSIWGYREAWHWLKDPESG